QGADINRFVKRDGESGLVDEIDRLVESGRIGPVCFIVHPVDADDMPHLRIVQGAGHALRALNALRALWAGRTLCAGRAIRTGLAIGTAFAGRAAWTGQAIGEAFFEHAVDHIAQRLIAGYDGTV